MIVPDTIMGGVVGLAIAVFGGGGVWAYLAAREKLSKSAPAAMVTADAGLTEAAGVFVEKLGQSWAKHTDSLREEIREQARRQGVLEDKVDDCERRHTECEVRVEDLARRLVEQAAREPLPAYLPGLSPAEMRARTTGGDKA